MGNWGSIVISLPPPAVVDPIDVHSFDPEVEGNNVRAKGMVNMLQRTLQRTAAAAKDSDATCNICVFGLMGHGKSRFLNLAMTAAVEGNQEICSEVPSGAGSTTRAYGRYVLPVHTRFGKSPFMMVDTIGVKFADESNPTPEEMSKEFELVSRQLDSLDFRGRVGAFKESYDVGLDHINKGEDVIDITDVDTTTSPQNATATVTLRGGLQLKKVPLTILYDPDGVNWSYDALSGTFTNKRSWLKRMQHSWYGMSYFQPKCHAVVLVTNPHVNVPQAIYNQWHTTFFRKGFDKAVLVATHADVRSLYEEEAQEAFERSNSNLAKIQLDSTGEPAFAHRVENYPELTFDKRLVPSNERRWLSEANALDAVYRACEYAQDNVQKSQTSGVVGLGVLTAAVGLTLLALKFRSASRRKFPK